MDERYARHQLISDWKQESLAQATVIVVGMGALGNEITRVLALAGVGRLVLCDPDGIETSNLSRTTLFKPCDVGRPKVEAAEDALKTLVPNLLIDSRPLPLIHGLGLAELRDADLVIGGLDSRSARLQLAGRCQLVRAPYLDGGTHPWGGEVRPYLQPDGPCYGCGLSSEGRAESDTPWSCLDIRESDPVGAAIPSSALVGTNLANIAIRFLMGLECPTEVLKIDAMRGTTTLVQQSKDPECPLHVPLGTSRCLKVNCENTVGELRSTLPEGTIPLSWEPIQNKLECPKGHVEEERWGIPKIEACPQCGTAMRPRTTLELGLVPSSIQLSDLGIAPREILPLRTPSGLEWGELGEL